MLIDTAARSPSSSAPDFAPAQSLESAPPLAARSNLAGGGDWMQSLIARSNGGEALTPVESGTLARIMDGAGSAHALPAALTYRPVPDGGYSSPPEPPKQHLSQSQIKSESQHILSVGDRSWQKDDYEARLKAFAQEMGKLDDSSRKALLAQILKDDSGATGSWLQGSRLLGLRDSGKISYTDAGAVVDGIADAYQAGDFGSVFDVVNFMAGGTSLTSMGYARPDQKQNLMDMLNAGSPAKMDALRESLGRQLLKSYVKHDPNFPDQPQEAVLALQIMGGSFDATMAGRAYGSFGAADRAKIYDAAADYYPGGKNSAQDPLPMLVNSVDAAGTDTGYGSTAGSGDKWSDIETDLVRYANSADTTVSKSALFWDSTHVISDRAAAYSNLLRDHGQVILDKMTDPRNQYVDPTGGDPGTTLVVADGRALANLMRATALAPDNPAHQEASDAIRNYIQQQHAALGDGKTKSAAGEQAINRLARLGAAAQFAGEQLKGNLEADAAARAQLVGFCADIALAAVPLGSKVSGAATKALESVFGSGAIAKATQNATGALIDKATGTLTDEGKKALTAALSSEGRDLANNIQASNLVKSAIFAGVGTGNIYNSELNQDMQDDVTALR